MERDEPEGSDRDDGDVGPRRPSADGAELTGLCSILGGPDIPCRVVDLEICGARVRTAARPPIGAVVDIALPGIGIVRGRAMALEPEGFAIGFADGAEQAGRIAGHLARVNASR